MTIPANWVPAGKLLSLFFVAALFGKTRMSSAELGAPLDQLLPLVQLFDSAPPVQVCVAGTLRSSSASRIMRRVRCLRAVFVWENNMAVSSAVGLHQVGSLWARRP